MMLRRHFSKRARVRKATAAAAATSAAPARSVKDELVNSTADKRLLLFFCDKQLQARAMAMAAGVQGVLGAAWTDSLWLVKNKLASEERLKQLREGFDDVDSVKWYDFMEWYDWALGSAVWLAPLLLLVATRYSTSRWVHSMTLLPDQRTSVVTYNMLGSKKERVLPNSAIMRTRTAGRLYLDGKTFLLHEKGQWMEKDVFDRIYRQKH